VRGLWCAAVLLLACERTPPGVVKEAEFGVFFGGQVQELKEIAKELDPGRQQHGFRLTFRAPLSRDVPVAWELSLPATDKGGPRAALVGQASAKVGQRLLEVPLAFRPTDPLGSWHAKVSADGLVVIDRDFTVVAPPPPPKAALKPLTPRSPNPSAPTPSTPPPQ
jgi:hypothetical protein